MSDYKYKLLISQENECILNGLSCFLLKDSESGTVVPTKQSEINFDASGRPIPNATNIPLACEIAEEMDIYGEIEASSVSNINTDFTLKETRETHWQHVDTLYLIAAVESRYEDMYHPQRKKKFWEIVSEDLASNNLNFNARKCKKWNNLLRTYKNTKDKTNKSGRGPTRFLYYDRLDELLGDKPNNCSPHSVDVATVGSRVLPGTSATVEHDSGSENEVPQGIRKKVQPSRKRKNPTLEYVKVKKAYYEQKEAAYSSYLEKKLVLQKQKLELDTRKVAALETLVALKQNQQN